MIRIPITGRSASSIAKVRRQPLRGPGRCPGPGTGSAHAGSQSKQGNAMTYTIIARCPRTGRLGIGTTTTSLACGRRNESVRPNVGISKSQAMYVRAHDPRALNLLASGFTPRAVMNVVEANDDDFEFRQTGIVDREGNAVAHTGAKCGKWAGHKVGPCYAAFGNWLSGPAVVDGLVDGFLADPNLPLEDRLLLALEA